MLGFESIHGFINSSHIGILEGIDLKMEALKIKRSRQLDGCKCSPPHGKSIED